MNKPYASSAEENHQPILKVLRSYLGTPGVGTPGLVLEIGSGTGQHAVYFAGPLSHLQWIATDREDQLAGIKLWIEEAGLSNLQEPLALDVSQPDWPVSTVDVVYTANTLHIMHWHEVQAFYRGVGEVLRSEGLCLIYGPFNYDGQYTSESNQRFDQWLKQRDAGSGIRDVAALCQLAGLHGLELVDDVEMPVNNRILVFQKHSPGSIPA